MGLLKSFFVKLGLDTDALSFAQGQVAVNALTSGINFALKAVGGLGEAIFGFNANAEATRLKLAAIGQMNLKMPWEDAKAAADELYQGLQKDAASTPAETSELVEFASGVASSYLQAGKSMKDLRQFTTQAVVAAKTLNMQGIAALDIRQALTRGAQADTPFINMMLASVNMTKEQFNSKKAAERADILAKAFDSPAIRNSMKEFETNWAGVTSTLSDNAKLIAGNAGKPIFDFTKKVLYTLGTWVQKNQGPITAFFTKVAKVVLAVGQTLYTVGKAVAALIRGIYGLGPVLGKVILGMAAAGAAIALFGFEAVTAGVAALLPWLAWGALLAVIALIVEDVYNGLTGGKSLIFELWDEWKGFLEDWIKPKAGDSWITTQLKNILDLILHIKRKWDEFADNFSSPDSVGAGLFGVSAKRQGKTLAGTGAEAVPLWKTAQQAEEDLKSGKKTFGAGGRYAAPTPAATINVTVSPTNQVTITGASDPFGLQTEMKKFFDEQNQIMLRHTKAALAGQR